MANKKKVTKEPSGLSIDLQSKKFHFSWKIGDKNYKDGQQLYYQVSTTDKSKKKAKTSAPKKYFGKNSNIGAKVTAKATKAFNWDKYYPKTKIYLNSISFTVRGKADKKAWSKWSTKKFDVLIPQKPKVYVDLSDEFDNVCNFSWGYAGSQKIKATEIRSYWQYRTGLSKNGETSISWGSWTDTTSSDKQFQEDVTFAGDYSYTRAIQVRACGPQGHSAAVEKKWVYAYPNKALNVKASAVPVSGDSGYKVDTSWTADNSTTHPIDSIDVEYAVVEPTSTISTIDGVVRTTLGCPDNPSWSGGGSYKDNKPNSKNIDVDGLVLSIDQALPYNNCIFIRVNTYHKPKTSNGDPVIASGGYGKLPDPILTEVYVEPSTNIATVKATNESSISASFLGVYYRSSAKPNEERLIGIIPAGESIGYFKLPDIETGTASVGVRAFVGDYSPVYVPATGSTAEVVDYTTSNIYMSSSDIKWQHDTIAAAPKIKLVQVPDKPTTVRVSWEWVWPEATDAEISWANHDDAWESTDGPTTYSVNTSHASQWNVTGLDIGTWYFRVRLIRTTGNSTIYGTYSATETIKLASTPSVPALWPTSATISQTGSVNLSWAFTSTDNTSQLQGEMCEAEIQNDGTFTYGQPFAKSGTAQNITVNAEDRGWVPNTPINRYYLTSDTEVVEEKTYYDIQAVESPLVDNLRTYYELSDEAYILTKDTAITEGKTYYLFNEVENPTAEGLPGYYDLQVTLGPTTYYVAVRVISTSGESSDGWSIPVPITIADLPVLKVRETSLRTLPIVIDDDTGETEDRLSLTDLPMSIATSGAGESGIMTYIIERASDYHIDRPDESDFDGYDNETIALIQTMGESEVSIGRTDCIGSLDDGAKYNLIITLTDTYGQSVDTTIPFWVYWEHQALMPEATVSVDSDNNIVLITPIAPKRYYKTQDDAVVVDKIYYSISAVDNPTVADLDTYYELSEPDVYILTEDTEIVSGKTYYVGNAIEDPDDEQVSTYFEMGYPGDTCDIYRLSVDKPELIVEDALFGVTYVDPYPTLGSFGGHRIVYKTRNGDYIIGDNTLAMTDYEEEQGDIVDMFATIVNFGNDEIILPYDLRVSNSWSKDFVETKYLGGSIQGDWNPAVSRTSTVSTTTIVFEDPDTIEQMRRLAVYPGICHVRTPDGSSFAANVAINEDREPKQINKIATFTLTITKVDSERLDGITYNEWISEQEQ